MRHLAAALVALSLLSSACGTDSALDAPATPVALPERETTEIEPAESELETPAATPSPASTRTPTPVPAPLTVPDVTIALRPVAEINRPVDMTYNPETGTVFVASQVGTIHRVDLATGESAVALDLSALTNADRERGLLGIAFGAGGNELYVNFTDLDGTTQVMAYPVSGDGFDGAAGRTLLSVDQPAPNHNGGGLVIGPDGYLWIALGDGGGAGDVFGQGQRPDTLLGTLLRVDPVGEQPYAIPSDNPFVDGGGAPEVFHWGLRNPWRFSFDRATGDLWIGDVGQDFIEEVDVLYASAGWNPGANMGWPILEGTEPFSGAADPGGLVGPIFQYTRDGGCSVTGGHVYRGSAIPELTGVYVYADYCVAELRGVVSNEAEGAIAEIGLGASAPPESLVSFGEGPDGELYVLSSSGTVSQIVPG